MRQLVQGERYLVGLPPFGVRVVQYLGPVPLLPRWCRVRLYVRNKVVWVRESTLRPLLVPIHNERTNR